MSLSSLTASSLARIHTAKAQDYLLQLCKHFRHKASVTQEGDRARIELTAGACELETGDADTLLVEASASDHTLLATVEDVVERHLKRFAFREELSVRWIRQV